ncbi:hypothetical protein RCL1_001837 [Eukaryota sp. TZLM3-RCL]
MTTPASPRVWIPLEANPEVLTALIHKLGVPTDYIFHDVYGLDPELLQMVPQPVHALLFLFPINKQTQELPTPENTDGDIPLRTFFAKQTIPNACGTMALIHSILNTPEIVDKLPQDSWFLKFLHNSLSLSPDQRAEVLNQDETLSQCHTESSHAGQSTVPITEEELENVWLHFIAFVPIDNKLVELDGRREAPVVHGATSQESFLNDVVPIIQKYITATESIEFNLMALVKM